MTGVDRPFQKYASAYDTLYQEKNYASECQFIEKAIEIYGSGQAKTILDLGCGTGNHAVPLAEKGYSVHGVDRSAEMLARANEKGSSSDSHSRLTWSEGSIESVDLDTQSDTVICMFAVLSYQTTNTLLRQTFDAASKHLRRGGLFIVDYWYGPAVLRDPPVSRTRDFVDGSERIRRTSTPNIDFNSHVVSVRYDMVISEDDKPVGSFNETHEMRYLFLPEIALFGELAGLTCVKNCAACDLSHPPSTETWTVSTIFRKD